MMYKCVKSFKVYVLDDDYMCTERQKTIKVGSLWEKTNTIEAYYWEDDTIHLNCIKGYNGFSFIEISKESLEKYFEILKNEDIKYEKDVYKN